MYKKIYHLCYETAKARTLVYLVLAYLFMTCFLLQWSVAVLTTFTDSAYLLDLQFSYSVSQTYHLLKMYGSEGREWYTLILLTIDTLIPLLYACILSLSIILIYKRHVKEQVTRMLFLVPLIALLADYAENMCIVLILMNYPYKLVLVAKAANIFTLVKWLGISAGVVIISSGLLYQIARYLRFKLITKTISR